MHEYSIKTHDRITIYSYLAVASVLVNGVIAYAASQFATLTSLAVATPSGVAVFAGLFLLLDRFIWRWRWLYRLGIIRVPNLGGRWQGQLVTSADNYTTKTPITVTVYQTYTKIVIRLDTDSSFSRSQMAALEMVDPSRFHLRWEYLAEPKNPGDPRSTDFRHYGVTLMLLTGEEGVFKKTQEALYYTEGDRDTSGKLFLDFVGA